MMPRKQVLMIFSPFLFVLVTFIGLIYLESRSVGIINPVMRLIVKKIPADNYVVYEAACYLFFHSTQDSQDKIIAKKTFRQMAEDFQNHYLYEAASRLWDFGDLIEKEIARRAYYEILKDPNNPDAKTIAQKLTYSSEEKDKEMANQFFSHVPPNS